MSVILTTLDSRHDHDEWLYLDLTSILKRSIAEIERAEQRLILREHAERCCWVHVIGPPTSRLAVFSFVRLPCSLQLPRPMHDDACYFLLSRGKILLSCSILGN